MYPLIATNFDEQQCYKILKPALGRALPSMGINRQFPQAVVHGPQSHHRLEIQNLIYRTVVHTYSNPTQIWTAKR